ncbi:ArsR/SmtB family transcription factor [Actinacidiphila acidipaludis]|uniref:Helix-turn-helix domain-containing protein n=1 Tax=Actinacidiphila acidipaludis TaxID=2873382 RepID=A0ABS7Q2K9_9ACTN|nr:helix-turn-helix domain-containing protein [Streptomyces acidipaludis]MBY8877377.1 helix-turn-helix domain-containing protein [Streptomyces acidipaludis]
MSLENDGRRVRFLDDPLAIRAMAHPIRLELQALLGQEGPLTATEAARRLGISQALASHHLRQLAKYDFVEPAPGKDNRERPWRVISTSQSWPRTELTPEGEAAVGVLEQLLAERALDRLDRWQRQRPGEEAVWRDNAGIDNTGIYLTAEEFAEVVGQMRELLQRYVDERPIDDKAARPPGSRHVQFTQIVTVSPPEGGEEG